MSFLSVDKTLAKAKSHAKKGEIQEARKSCEMLLKSYPQNVRVRQFIESLENTKSLDTIINKLTYLYNQADYQNVLKEAQRNLNFFPNNVFLWNFIGVGNLALGNDHIALEAFIKTTNLNPQFVDGHNNWGVTLDKIGELDEAIKVYHRAISINPSFAKSYNNLGNVLRKKGENSKAIDMFYKAISIEPDYVDALNNLGIVLYQQVKVSQAINSFKKALSLKPECSATLNSLGNCYKDLESFDQAIDMYNKALLFYPDFEMARAQKLYLLAAICDWEAIEEDRSFISSLGINKNFVPPFALLTLEDNLENQKKRAETFSKLNFLQKSIPFKTSPVIPKKRIRIGYFSADFHNHATMHLISKIFTLHDRDEFEIYAYSYGPKKDDYMRQHLINSVDVFDDVSQMNDQDIALLARQDEIDIAIDLKGHTHHARAGIFAYRAAPIQINFLGYPGTMGANFIDYIIADRTIIPEKFKNYYSEDIIYMPNSYQPNNNQRPISSRNITKQEMGLPEDSFVFCSFNNNYKITKSEFDIWMNILKRVEGSVLWLLKSNRWAENNLKREAENRGVDIKRLIFAEKVSTEEHLARHKLADLFLDTFNVNAHTTASDALWAGLPVVTKLGNSFVARVAGSLLNAMGLPELVTENEKDYESLIIDLALNPDKLLKIKEKLLINRISQPLFDSEMYTKHLENGYKKAYEYHVNGIMQQTIDIKS